MPTRKGEDHRITTLNTAQLAYGVGVVGQLVIGKKAAGDDISAHCLHLLHKIYVFGQECHHQHRGHLASCRAKVLATAANVPSTILNAAPGQRAIDRLAWINQAPVPHSDARSVARALRCDTQRSNARNWCTERTAADPSPTAEATRFIEPDLTSPTANSPGLLVDRHGRSAG